MESGKYLNLSTAHLSDATKSILEKQPEQIDIPVYPKGDYGWFIYVTHGLINWDNIPADLAACMTLAAKNNCDIICFDSDVTPLPNLACHDL